MIADHPGRVDAVPGADLHQDRRDLVANCLVGELQPAGNLHVGPPRTEQRHNLQLAGRQPVERALQGRMRTRAEHGAAVEVGAEHKPPCATVRIESITRSGSVSFAR